MVYNMSRHQLREQVFKLLFRVEFNSPEDMQEQKMLFVEDDEVKMSEEESAYVTGKYEEIAKSLPEIDTMINEKTEGWSTDRMGKVDLTIIRLAIYEMLHDETVPASVAINEAVELAKEFGQDGSGKFVNAILAKFV